MTRRLWDVFIRLFCIYILILTFFAGLSGPPIDMPEWIPVVLVALALLLAAVLGPAEYIEWRRHQAPAETSDDTPASLPPEPDTAASRVSPRASAPVTPAPESPAAGTMDRGF